MLIVITRHCNRHQLRGDWQIPGNIVYVITHYTCKTLTVGLHIVKYTY